MEADSKGHTFKKFPLAPQTELWDWAVPTVLMRHLSTELDSKQMNWIGVKKYTQNIILHVFYMCTTYTLHNILITVLHVTVIYIHIKWQPWFQAMFLKIWSAKHIHQHARYCIIRDFLSSMMEWGGQHILSTKSKKKAGKNCQKATITTLWKSTKGMHQTENHLFTEKLNTG